MPWKKILSEYSKSNASHTEAENWQKIGTQRRRSLTNCLKITPIYKSEAFKSFSKQNCMSVVMYSWPASTGKTLQCVGATSCVVFLECFFFVYVRFHIDFSLVSHCYEKFETEFQSWLGHNRDVFGVNLLKYAVLCRFFKSVGIQFFKEFLDMFFEDTKFFR